MVLQVLEPSNEQTNKKKETAEHKAGVLSSAGSEPLAPSMSFDCALCTARFISLIFDPFIHRSRVIATKLACLWSAFARFTGSALPRIYYANTNTSKSIANSFGRAGRYWSGGDRSYNVCPLSHSSLLFASQGSGKTLAYGLPILHHILSHPRLPGTRRKLQALVLAPTRELALQVSDHLNVFSRVIGISEEAQNVDLKGKEKRLETRTPVPPLVSIAAVVGGMSSQKQRRILERGVDVLVATPGRLWDTLEEVCDPYFTRLNLDAMSSRMRNSQNKSAN